MRRLAYFVVCLLLSACGPMTKPMVDRLPPEEQKRVDGSWDNMMSPPSRLDRDTLLDVILVYELHQQGVDRLQLVSEKKLKYGRILMEIRFAREDPAADEFIVRYVSNDGNEDRRERYTRGDIERRLDVLYSRRSYLACSQPTSCASQPTPCTSQPAKDENRGQELFRGYLNPIGFARKATPDKPDRFMSRTATQPARECIGVPNEAMQRVYAATQPASRPTTQPVGDETGNPTSP